MLLVFREKASEQARIYKYQVCLRAIARQPMS